MSYNVHDKCDHKKGPNAWYWHNHSQQLKKNRAYTRNNAARIAQRQRAIRLDIIVALGGTCRRCSYHDDLRALVVDHVAGDGYLIRRGHGYNRPIHAGHRSQSPAKTLREILNTTDKYQLLCANCNTIKAQEEKAYQPTRPLVEE